jgi:hypothetical protein
MNWLEEEQQRFHRLTASKVKEFSVCVQENIEWISNYVDELLQGHKKTYHSLHIFIFDALHYCWQGYVGLA